MKKIVTILMLSFILSLTLSPIGLAKGNEVNVMINGEKQSYGQQSPIIMDGHTLVPVRETFTALGATIAAGKPYTSMGVIKGRTSIWLKIGSKQIKVNGQPMTLDTPAVIVNGRTMVPIRFIAEAFQADVRWNAQEKTAQINNFSIDSSSFVLSRAALLKHAKETKPSYANIDTSYDIVDFDVVFNEQSNQSVYISVNEWSQSSDFAIKGTQTKDMKDYMKSVLTLYFPYSADKIADAAISGDLKQQNVDGLNISTRRDEDRVVIKIWEN
ncbi:copper amine oxidase N-terminal domain-containing protein [Rossellomorea sp. NPDC077527]|uniref:copper amine oxidase N-terminal domain-containing protein n=1 Tax=Rossellomorea sp. NPDC077527 TaxID=3364510 RepID=UPI0037C91EB8